MAPKRPSAPASDALKLQKRAKVRQKPQLNGKKQIIVPVAADAPILAARTSAVIALSAPTPTNRPLKIVAAMPPRQTREPGQKIPQTIGLR